MEPRKQRPWLASISLALACVPAVLGAYALRLYAQKPPPLSGFEGVGWSIAMIGVITFLLIGTYVAAPLAMLSGMWALRRLRRGEPPHRGRRRAVAGVVLAALSLAAVATGHVVMNSRVPRADSATAAEREARDHDRATAERAARLVAACRAYAYANDDHYPADMNELRRWCAENGRWSDELKSEEFLYFGAGVKDMTREKVSANEIELVGRMILFMQKTPSSAGTRVIGFSHSSAHVASASSVTEDELPIYLRRANEERRRRGLPEMDFALPSTRPADQ